MNELARNTATEKASKALKFILVSGVGTFILTGLITIVTQLQSGEIDYSALGFTLILLLLNATLNLVIYWLAKYNEATDIKA